MKLSFALLALVLLAGPASAAQKAYDGSTIVDYGDPEYSEGGAWQNGDKSWEMRGQSYTLARRTSDTGAWAKWAPDLPAGDYWVSLWNIPYHAQDSKARVEVVHAGGTTVIPRDMRDGYYGWVPLGKFRWAAGSYVKVTRGDQTLVVDAARFQPAALVKKPAPLEPYPKADGKLPYIDRPGPTGRLILGGKPYLMLGGELENGSALHPEDIPFMDSLFDILVEQRINTIEAPIAWRQLEPKEGEFDFRVIDALIERARARNMHLAILWFGTYKNLQSYYSPVWMHTNHQRFPFAVDKEGKLRGCVSPFCEEALRLDERAFGKLLGRIKERDPNHQVVLMVQVENEMPSWRDYSEPAQKAWGEPVPAELLRAIQENEKTVSPWLRDLWTRNGRKTVGTWAEVFGESDAAGRVFGSWTYGRFADQVAAAGKKVLNLPMYVNSWQGESPCWHQYMDVFHAAAPSIDFMGPDLYIEKGYGRECALAGRPWNNLVVPENDSRTSSSARAWTAYGTYGALFFGSYLGPETGWTHCKETFSLMADLAPLILQNKGTGNMAGFHQEVPDAGDSWEEPFQGGRLCLVATTTVDPRGECNNVTGGELPGCGLICQVRPGEYLLAGSRVVVEWHAPAGKRLHLKLAEEGRYQNGRWQRTRNAAAEEKDGVLTFHFPVENALFRQIRCVVETLPAQEH